jgi:phosphatidate phosphatase APP1
LKNSGGKSFVSLVPDAETYLVPSVAYALPNGSWKIEFCGWHNRPMDRGVRRYMFDRCFTGFINARGERMSMKYHKERLACFLVEDLPHTDLKLRLITDNNQSKIFNVNTDTLGYFSSSINIDSIDKPERIEHVDIEGKSVGTSIIAVQGYGLSVISDIDDTLKISMVNTKQNE